MKQMYKVTFSYKEDFFGSGFGSSDMIDKFFGWNKEIIPIEAENDMELQNKINHFKQRNNSRKYIEVVDITKL